MTAAQIFTAYDLVKRAGLMDSDIVSLMEIGSEGAVLRFKNASMADAILIARDGTYRARGTSRAYLFGVPGEEPW